MTENNSNSPAVADLQAVYDQYVSAVRARNFDEAKKLLTGRLQSEMYPPEIGPEELAQFADMAVAMQPISYQVENLGTEGEKAALNLTANLNDVQNPGKTQRIEMLVGFAKEDGSWKIAAINYQMNPDTIKRSPDQNFEPRDSYDFDRNTTLGGRIVSVKFEQDYTMVVIRMMDEENLVFLPSKAILEKDGLPTDQLVPWKIVQVEGHPHQSNPLKVWGETAKLVEAPLW